MELAQRSGAELNVLHVPTPDAPTEPGAVSAPQYLDQPQHEWPLWEREFLERTLSLSERPPSIRTRPFLRRGEPGDEILRFVREREGDLIVLAWHGQPGARAGQDHEAGPARNPLPNSRSARGTASRICRRDSRDRGENSSSSEQPQPDDIPEGGHAP